MIEFAHDLIMILLEFKQIYPILPNFWQISPFMHGLGMHGFSKKIIMFKFIFASLFKFGI